MHNVEALKSTNNYSKSFDEDYLFPRKSTDTCPFTEKNKYNYKIDNTISTQELK